MALQSLGFSAFQEHWLYWIGPFIKPVYFCVHCSAVLTPTSEQVP